MFHLNQMNIFPITFIIRIPQIQIFGRYHHRNASTINNTNNPLLYLRLLQRKTRRRRTSSFSSINSYALLRFLKSSSRIITVTDYNYKLPLLPAIITHATIVHSLTITLGFQSIVFLQTALISMYSSSGHINDAHRLFDEMSQPSLVAWTALISAYVNNHNPATALYLFRNMQLHNVQPDPIALTVALSACADLGALDVGEWIHTYIRKQQGPLAAGQDLILTNALINMYCKCGDIRTARQLFQMTDKRDVTTWTSIIVGYALHGRADEALQLFDNMTTTCSNCKPNGVTFVGVLTACSHAGLVDQGKWHWETMRRYYKLKPSMAHYGCMVDLLCRAGQLEEAYEFIQRMPIQGNAVIWRTLLGACSLKGNVSLGKLARRRLLELEHGSVNDGVSISNAYAKLGMWDDKEQVRKHRGRRAPGCSLIEVGSIVQEFVAGDTKLMKNLEIQQVIQGIMHCSKDFTTG